MYRTNYTSEIIPVIDSTLDDADEILSLYGLGEILFYGMGFVITPFTVTLIEGFNMRHVPLNSEVGIITAAPVYNYNTATEQLSLYYEAFSQM